MPLSPVFPVRLRFQVLLSGRLDSLSGHTGVTSLPRGTLSRQVQNRKMLATHFVGSVLEKHCWWKFKTLKLLRDGGGWQNPAKSYIHEPLSGEPASSTHSRRDAKKTMKRPVHRAVPCSDIAEGRARSPSTRLSTHRTVCRCGSNEEWLFVSVGASSGMPR